MCELLNDLLKRNPVLEPCKEDIFKAYELMAESYSHGNKLLIAGNGGSASDADHIVGELMKGFVLRRKLNKDFAKKICDVDETKGKELVERLQSPLTAIALHNHNSLNTAFINDINNGGQYCFAQQMLGYGKKDDVFLAISTSGNSANVVNACIVAKALGLKIIGLLGKTGGEIKKYCDASIVVPLSETYLIQEQHIAIYHCLCLMLEKTFFK